MQDEFNFNIKKHLRILLLHWEWILVSAIIAGVLGIIVASTSPAKYISSSAIALTAPFYYLHLNENYSTVNITPPIKAYTDIALSNSVMNSIYKSLQKKDPKIAEQYSPQNIKGILNVKPGIDQNQTVMYLEVISDNPKTAQVIASLWTTIFMQQTNKIFGQANPEQLSYLEERQAAMMDQYFKAVDAYEQYNKKDKRPLLQAELENILSQRMIFLSKQNEIEQQNIRIQTELDIIVHQNDSALAATSDQIAVLAIQLDVTSFLRGLSPSLTMQFQVNSADLFKVQTIGDLRSQLAAMQIALKQESETLALSISSMGDTILSLEYEIQKYSDENEVLVAVLKVARDSRDAISMKITEVLMSSDMNNVGIRLISAPVVPEDSTQPSKVLYGLIGFLVGGGLLISIIQIFKWWRSPS
jgi:uncharacterized protein involved in exopolysaccharide biosynthesis